MKNVLLIFGGRSNEHEVSIRSAKSVLTNFPRESFNPLPVYIDQGGIWYTANDFDVEIPENLSGIKDVFNKPTTIHYINGKTYLSINGSNDQLIDIIFPIIHGQNGEDGVMQGLARALNIPIAGPSFDTAFVTYDKDLTKTLASRGGVMVAAGITYMHGGELPSWKVVTEMLGDIVFIKPSRSGSSVGVSKAKNEQEFISGIEVASKEDNKILIESGVIGREIEVAVFVAPDGQCSIAQAIGEVLPPEESFYTYEEKYANESATGLVVGAEFSDDERKKIFDAVNKTIMAINIVGSARIDFFLTADGQVVLNEINTIPGFTSISMYPKLFGASGTSFVALLSLMLKNPS